MDSTDVIFQIDVGDVESIAQEDFGEELTNEGLSWVLQNLEAYLSCQQEIRNCLGDYFADCEEKEARGKREAKKPPTLFTIGG